MCRGFHSFHSRGTKLISTDLLESGNRPCYVLLSFYVKLSRCYVMSCYRVMSGCKVLSCYVRQQSISHQRTFEDVVFTWYVPTHSRRSKNVLISPVIICNYCNALVLWSGSGDPGLVKVFGLIPLHYSAIATGWTQKKLHFMKMSSLFAG